MSSYSPEMLALLGLFLANLIAFVLFYWRTVHETKLRKIESQLRRIEVEAEHRVPRVVWPPYRTRCSDPLPILTQVVFPPRRLSAH